MEKKTRLIFDTQWREVSFEKLPFVPFEDKPGKALSNVDKKYEITLPKKGKRN